MKNSTRNSETSESVEAVLEALKNHKEDLDKFYEIGMINMETYIENLNEAGQMSARIIEVLRRKG